MTWTMEAIVVAVGSVVGVITWLLRLDGRVSRHDEVLHDLVPTIKSIERKVDRIAINCIAVGHSRPPPFGTDRDEEYRG